MNNIFNKFYEDVAEKWKLNKGIGSVYCVKPLDFADLIANIINKVLLKNENSKIFIAVDKYESSKHIKEVLKNNNIDVNKISILTEDYIKTGYKYKYDLIIIANINRYNHIIEYLKSNTKFILMILTVHNINNNLNELYELFPLINSDISIESIRNAKLNSPVEEHRIGIDLNNEDKELYEKYSKFITNTMTILGSIDNIKYIKYGNSKLGLSAVEVRNNIAKENGWSENLDMSIPFNKQIDDNYNPNILLEKTDAIHEIIKQRRDLVTDNKEKLNSIVSILTNNKYKRYIIISKRGEFAAFITKHLNSLGFKCGDYHDCIEKQVAVDINGKPILIKTGVNKGKPKILGAQAISSCNLRSFLNEDINILSTKNSSINSLNLLTDAIIITSPLCDDIDKLKCKFANIDFSTSPNIIYKIYCNSTIESKQLCYTKSSTNKIIINDTEEIIDYDENSGDIIL